LFRGRLYLRGLDQKRNFAVPQAWRSLRAAGLVAACCAVLLLGGCQTYDPNLGAAASQSSAISLLTPSARPATCPGFTLDVLGTGFTSGATVQWNGSDRPTNFESGTELLATINTSDLAMQAPVSIDVSTPGQAPGNNLSNFVSFVINPPPVGSCPSAPTFPPKITSVSPVSGTVGTSITISGNYFGGTQGTSTIAFNGTIATPTSWSGTSLVAPVPTGATTGNVVVTVSGVPNATNVFSLFQVLSSSGMASAGITSAVPVATSRSFSISSGPRYAAFVAPSPDPSADAGTGVDKIFLRDTCQGAPAGCTPVTIVVSVGFDGADSNGASRSPSIGANGRFVAFASDANNLVMGDANGVADIFLRDTCIGVSSGCTPATTRLSVGPDGIEANGASASPSMSPDGRFVAFDSAATNLIFDGLINSPGISTGAFLRDTCFGVPSGCTPSTTRLAITSHLPN
jgi:hypothetical protein